LLTTATTAEAISLTFLIQKTTIASRLN